MAYKLPSLNYEYDALEPFIDARTMEIHHTKHHQAYTDKLNAAVEKYPELGKQKAEELIANLQAVPEEIREAVRNNGGGYINHNFFWTIMEPAGQGKPAGDLATEIDNQFGEYPKFVEQFTQTALSVFGSGWAWLSVDGDNQLQIIKTSNQDSPLALGFTPILCLDVWEHAYYLKYQNRRPDYVAAWWNVVNWDQVDRHYQAAIL